MPQRRAPSRSAAQRHATADPTPAAGPRLRPLQVPKSSDVLAADLRERILSGQFPVDTALPSEREMTAQTGMSRSTVREALRILEVQGLVAMRTGRSGGAYVRRPDAQSTADSIGILLRGHNVRLESLLAIRELLEPGCARQAAQHATPADLETLAGLTTQMESSPVESANAFRTAYTQWHVALAAASGNELFHAIIQALAAAIYEATDQRPAATPAVRTQAILAHRRIAEAIAAGDGDAAERRMRRHVRTYAHTILALEKDPAPRRHGPDETPSPDDEAISP